MILDQRDASIEGIAKLVGARTAIEATGIATAFTSTTGGTILDQEPSRVGYIITNCEASGGPTLYIRHHADTNPTTSNFDYQLAPGQSLNMTSSVIYTGVVRGRFSATPSNGARAARFF